MNILKSIEKTSDLGIYIGNYLQEKGILLDINDCYNKLDDSSTNNYISEINKLGFITVCSDSYKYSNKNIKSYSNDMKHFYKSIYNLSENITKVVDVQNLYYWVYSKKSNFKLLNYIFKNKEFSNIIMNTTHNNKTCTVKFNLIEYNEIPTANRNIIIETENNIYNYPFNSWGGWKIIDFEFNDIKNSYVLSEKVKEDILNNYMSVQFTTTNHKHFFEKIIEIFKKI